MCPATIRTGAGESSLARRWLTLGAAFGSLREAGRFADGERLASTGLVLHGAGEAPSADPAALRDPKGALMENLRVGGLASAEERIPGSSSFVPGPRRPISRPRSGGGGRCRAATGSVIDRRPCVAVVT